MPKATPEFLTCVRFSSPGMTVTVCSEPQLGHHQQLRHLVGDRDSGHHQQFERSLHGLTGSASASDAAAARAPRDRLRPPPTARCASSAGTSPRRPLLTAIAVARSAALHDTGDRRHDEQHRQAVLVMSQQRQVVARRDDLHRAAERGPGRPAVLPPGLELRVHGVAQRQQLLPALRPSRRRRTTSAAHGDGNSSRCTRDSAVPGSAAYNCSAVTGRIGATSRASPSTIVEHHRLRADRRLGDCAASV